MFTLEQHVDNLTRHISLVRDTCVQLGKKLIALGERELGRNLIARGFCHDNSKFHGIEWDFLHVGPDVDKEKLALAVKHHSSTNDHHPEFWGNINAMSEPAMAEMVCDWHARSWEFGNSVREWSRANMVERFGATPETCSRINRYIDLLLENSFAK